MISSEEAAEMYGITPCNITQQLKKGNKHVHKIGSFLYIDDVALLKRREFANKIWNQANDNYFAITELISESDLARLLFRYLPHRTLSSWYVFVNNQLFSIAFKDRSLLAYKVPAQLWEFYRITRAIIRSSQRYNWRKR